MVRLFGFIFFRSPDSFILCALRARRTPRRLLLHTAHVHFDVALGAAHAGFAMEQMAGAYRPQAFGRHLHTASDCHERMCAIRMVAIARPTPCLATTLARFRADAITFRRAATRLGHTETAHAKTQRRLRNAGIALEKSYIVLGTSGIVHRKFYILCRNVGVRDSRAQVARPNVSLPFL